MAVTVSCFQRACIYYIILYSFLCPSTTTLTTQALFWEEVMKNKVQHLVTFVSTANIHVIDVHCMASLLMINAEHNEQRKQIGNLAKCNSVHLFFFFFSARLEL